MASERTTSSVDVLGRSIGVKIGRLDGRVTNVSVEYEDVAALARERGVPAKEALRAATAAAAEEWPVAEPGERA